MVAEREERGWVNSVPHQMTSPLARNSEMREGNFAMNVLTLGMGCFPFELTKSFWKSRRSKAFLVSMGGPGGNEPTGNSMIWRRDLSHAVVQGNISTQEAGGDVV